LSAKKVLHVFRDITPCSPLKVNRPVASIFWVEVEAEKETSIYEVDDLYLWQNMSTRIKSKRIRWAGHEESMGEKRT
jgi:hypothetical protein